MKSSRSKTPKVNMKNLRSFVKFYKKLQTSQKTGLVIGALTVLIIPVAVVATQQQVRNNSKAYDPIKTIVCKNYWVPDTKSACKLIHSCDGTQTPPNGFKLESECLGSLGVTCQKLWWTDAQSKNCQQKTFCGNYMYRGLKTFTSQDTCQKSFHNNK